MRKMNEREDRNIAVFIDRASAVNIVTDRIKILHILESDKGMYRGSPILKNTFSYM